MPFVCSETIELGEELVGSYLHKVHLHDRLESDKNAASRRILYIKVERIVCLLDRSDFEPGQNFCAAHLKGCLQCLSLETTEPRDDRLAIRESFNRDREKGAVCEELVGNRQAVKAI